MMPTPRKKKKLDNFKTAVGMGMNWVDLDTGVLYHIQEYKDQIDDPTIPTDKKPTKIRMTRLRTGEELGWADEYTVSERMKDPDPDPKYEAETAKEHRRSW